MSNVHGHKDVERAIAELQDLGRKRPLGEEEMVRVKWDMKTLRENGYSNNEISTLTMGAWKQPTTKQYTAGTRVVNPATRERAIQLLAEAIDRNINLDKVERALEVDDSCRKSNVILEEVASAVGDAKAHGTSPFQLVDNYHKAKQGIKQALHQNELADKQLKAKKLNIDNLERKEKALDERIAKKQSEPSKLDRLEAKGFDEPVLNELDRRTRRFSGPKKVFKEIETYTKHNNLESGIAKLERQKSDLRSQVRQYRDQLFRMKPVSKMCQDLYKSGYNVESLQSIHDAAQKHGQPEEVLRAICKFGTLKAIDAEIIKTQRQLEELKKEILNAEGSYAAFNDLVSRLINLLGEISKEGIENVVKVCHESITSVRSEAEEYAKRLAAAETFQEELKMARVILSIKNYPNEAAKLPTEYLLLLQRGIINVLKIRVLNPIINMAFELEKRKLNIMNLSLIDILDISSGVLESELRF